jgi:predicted CDP-diglyceride synthetase/phosphatidate cytidylyltransferase
MNWNLGQLLYISDWSKFVGPKLDFILDQTHCIWAYWVTGFILAIGPAGMAINKNNKKKKNIYIYIYITFNLSQIIKTKEISKSLIDGQV